MGPRSRETRRSTAENVGKALSDCKNTAMEFPDLLREMLPELGLEWRRHHRRAIRRRVVRRMDEIGLRSYARYRDRLREDPEERRRFAAELNVTITRLFRNRDRLAPLLDAAFDRYRQRTESPTPCRILSCGCAGGEEPYTVAILFDLWNARTADGNLPPPRITACDIDDRCLERARRAIYSGTCLREIPAPVLASHFEPVENYDSPAHRPIERIRRQVRFVRRNVLVDGPPDGPFDIVLCRNLAYTYFAEAKRVAFTEELATCMTAGAALLVGSSESIPPPRAGSRLRTDPSDSMLAWKTSSADPAADG